MLPVVHCLYLKILLIFRCAAQSKCFCISDKTVIVSDALNISYIRSLLKNQARKSHCSICFVNHNISIFGVQFLFAGVVPITFRDYTT